MASRHSADRVAGKLQAAGIRAAALHGDCSQGQRGQVLADLKSGRLQVLVATDVAARGIDIARLPAVVNYDLPRSPVDYTHRIGRTGRAMPAARPSASSAPIARAFPIDRKTPALAAAARAHRRFRAQGRRAEAPMPANDGNGGIKGKRKSKKDKLREAAAREQAERS